MAKIIIIGAGPAGCSAALQLNKMEIPCLLLDKESFPRDKTCGDAVTAKARIILGRIDQDILKRFLKLPNLKKTWGIQMHAPNKTKVDLPFKWDFDKENDEAPGFVISRMELDNFLVEEVRKAKFIDFRENVNIENYQRKDNSYIIKGNKGSFEEKADLLLIANGAHSKFSREEGGIKKENKHYAGAVRAYYKNVTGLHPDSFIELHFLKEYIPGYFWIFPMENNMVNIGLGLRSDYISKRRVNLKKSLLDIIENHPDISCRFENAEAMSKIKGHPLPLGSKRYRISGDNYMLLGDAAHLIDPFSGEGVGNAMYSGWVAGEQIAHCLEKNDFSSDFLKAYDQRIHRVMGPELKLSYRMQQMLVFPWLSNMLANRIVKSEGMTRFLIRIYSDLELRKKVTNPLYLPRLLFGRFK